MVGSTVLCKARVGVGKLSVFKYIQGTSQDGSAKSTLPLFINLPKIWPTEKGDVQSACISISQGME